MASSIEADLNRANEQLKSERVSVKIKRRGNALFLVGTLPPKPSSKKQKPHQQEISLKKLQAEHANILYAQEQARRVDRDLKNSKFDWSEYSSKIYAETHKTIGVLLEEFKKDYWQMHPKGKTSEINWHRSYWAFFKKLDLKAELSLKELIKVIEKYEPDTQSRSKCCQKFVKFAEWCDLPTSDIRKIRSLKGKYGISKTRKRKILTDQQIVDLRVQIPPGPLRWMFEVLVVWGLRPHEVYEIDMEKLAVERDGIITVFSQKTKRERIVSAIYPEWFKRWELWKGMPPPTNREREKGKTVTYYFKKLNLEIYPYDLRHAWAVRALYYPKIDEAQAAAQMGHSLKIHQQVYEYWITEQRARAEQLKRMYGDEKIEVPDDPPEGDYRQIRLKDDPLNAERHPQNYSLIPCPKCGSNSVIWNGWAINQDKLYGRRQKCQVCNFIKTIKPTA
jgi:integrase